MLLSLHMRACPFFGSKRHLRIDRMALYKDTTGYQMAGLSLCFKDFHIYANTVIPDNARITWSIRAPTNEELSTFSERVHNCFQ